MPRSMSGYCGFRACSVLFYVRRGSLLKLEMETLSIGVDVGRGKRPKIKLMSHDFRESTIRWSNGRFR